MMRLGKKQVLTIVKKVEGKKLLGYRYVNVRLTEIFITFAPKTRTK